MVSSPAKINKAESTNQSDTMDTLEQSKYPLEKSITTKFCQMLRHHICMHVRMFCEEMFEY